MRVLPAAHIVLWTAVLAGGTHAFAQAGGAAQPRFDVVSIRRNTSAAPNTTLSPAPNGLTGINVTVRRLLRVAYGVADFQILDAPGWFDSEHYDVIARAATAIAPSELGPMIKGLLADRFGLQVQEGMRDVAGFELRVERAGAAGLRPAAASCSAVPVASPPRPDQPAPPVCFSSFAGEMTARGVPPALLARQLTAIMGRPVVDRTELATAFDFELRWQPDAPAGGASDIDRPPLVTAIREQLGLRLVPAPAPAAVIVVTSATRPQEN